MNRSIAWAGVLLTSSIAFAQSGEWEQIADEDGVRVHTRPVEGSDVNAFRGQGVFDVHIAKVISLFVDPERTTEWVDLLAESVRLEQFSEDRYLLYNRFDMPWPASDRDYVWMVSHEVDRKNASFRGRFEPVVDKRKPVQDCCVRAASRFVWTFTATTGPDRTRIEVEVWNDAGGSIPTFMTNRGQRDWPRKSIRALVEGATAPKTKPHPKYVAW